MASTDLLLSLRLHALQHLPGDIEPRSFSFNNPQAPAQLVPACVQMTSMPLVILTCRSPA